MKFKITLKDPDGYSNSIDEAVAEIDLNWLASLPDERVDEVMADRKEELNEIASKWFSYEEYVTLEIDTEAKTCVVLPRK